MSSPLSVCHSFIRGQGRRGRGLRSGIIGLCYRSTLISTIRKPPPFPVSSSEWKVCEGEEGLCNQTCGSVLNLTWEHFKVLSLTQKAILLDLGAFCYTERFLSLCFESVGFEDTHMLFEKTFFYLHSGHASEESLNGGTYILHITSAVYYLSLLLEFWASYFISLNEMHFEPTVMIVCQNFGRSS